MKAFSKEKREIITAFQDAVGRSAKRLEIIKNINRRESISELSKRLKIPQPTVSKAITSFESYGLIISMGKKGKSEVYDKVKILKTFSNLDFLVRIEVKGGEFEPKKIKKYKIQSQVPFLDSSDEKNAEKMAEPYIALYLFENSLRKFIEKKLTETYSEDWWTKINLKLELIKKVKDRKDKEGINRWHVARGSSEIYYTDLSDLIYLLNKEEKIFGKNMNLKHWVLTIENAISLSRNIIDHHNPLPDKELKRLRMILDDWKKEFKVI